MAHRTIALPRQRRHERRVQDIVEVNGFILIETELDVYTPALGSDEG